MMIKLHEKISIRRTIEKNLIKRVILTIISFIPIILEKNYNHPNFYKHVNIGYCFVASLGIVFPATCRNIIDFLYNNMYCKNYKEITFPSLWISWIQILLIDIIYLGSIFPTAQTSTLPSLCSAIRILCFGGLMETFTTLQKDLWNTSWNIYLEVFFCLSQLIISFLASGSHSYDHVLGILLVVVQICFLIPCLRFVYLTVKTELLYYKNIHKGLILVSSKSIKISLAIILISAVYIFYAIFSARPQLFKSSTFLCADIYISNIILVTVQLLYDCLVKVRVELCQENEKKKTKSTLAKYLSHQIRTPLNSITLGLTCLRSLFKKITPEALPSSGINEVAEILSDSFNSCAIANLVLDNVITYEKLSAGALALYPSLVLADAFAWTALSPYHDLAKARQISFSVSRQVADSLDIRRVSLSVDPSRMRSVLRTLMENSFKYSKRDDKVTVTLDYQRTPDPASVGLSSRSVLFPLPVLTRVRPHNRVADSASRDFSGSSSDNSKSFVSKGVHPAEVHWTVVKRTRSGRAASSGSHHGSDARRDVENAVPWRCGKLIITIADQGRGIEQSEIDELFDRSIRFETGNQQHMQGSGLSLWIARRIVTLHQDCHLEVTSQGPGKGCEFRLSMPLYTKEMNIVENAARNEETDIIGHRTGRMEEGLGSFEGYWQSQSSGFELDRCVDPRTAEIHPDNCCSGGIDPMRDRPHPPLKRRSLSANSLQSLFGRVASPGSVEVRRPSQRSIRPDSSKVYCIDDVVEQLSNRQDGAFGAQSNTTRVPPEAVSGAKTSIGTLSDSAQRLSRVNSSCFSIAAGSQCDSGRMRDTAAASHPASNYRVLVVDDAPMNLKMMVRILRDTCGTIDKAEDGVQALNKVRNCIATANQYDFVLMDYQMPNMNGADAARAMRVAGYFGPIIGITGNAHEHDLRTFLSSGADSVLTKPLDVVALSETLRGLGVSLSMDR